MRDLRIYEQKLANCQIIGNKVVVTITNSVWSLWEKTNTWKKPAPFNYYPSFFFPFLII